MNDTVTPNGDDENPTNQPSKQGKPVNVPLLRLITLIGYFGLLILMPGRRIWLNPSEGISIKLSLAFFWLPLFFPMRGLLKGTPYTYAWANFVVMIYFMHGFTTLWVIPEDLLYAILELIFATMMFLGGTYYARHKGRELGLKLPKLKDLK